jgi:hypothetical protein
MRAIRTNLLSFCVLGLASVAALAAADGKLSFSPLCDVKAEVVANGQQVTITVRQGADVVTETIAVDTEKKLKLAVDDFNFDGHPDFVISHTDDGMGTYTISQIYSYSAKEKKFVALTPKCGDEFINVVVSKKKRTLTNSYMVDNRYKTCTMKF